jgi:hypothetical protein
MLWPQPHNTNKDQAKALMNMEHSPQSKGFTKSWNSTPRITKVTPVTTPHVLLSPPFNATSVCPQIAAQQTCTALKKGPMANALEQD